MNWLRNSAVVALVACMLHGLRVRAIEFDKCASGPAPIAVIVDGHEHAPLVFKKGETVKVTVIFQTVAIATALELRLAIFVLHVPVTMDLLPKDACPSLVGTTCPVPANTNVTWAYTGQIPKDVPTTGGRAQISFVDSNKRTHACFQIEARVED